MSPRSPILSTPQPQLRSRLRLRLGEDKLCGYNCRALQPIDGMRLQLQRGLDLALSTGMQACSLSSLCFWSLDLKLRHTFSSFFFNTSQYRYYSDLSFCPQYIHNNQSTTQQQDHNGASTNPSSNPRPLGGPLRHAWPCRCLVGCWSPRVRTTLPLLSLVRS